MKVNLGPDSFLQMMKATGLPVSKEFPTNGSEIFLLVMPQVDGLRERVEEILRQVCAVASDSCELNDSVVWLRRPLHRAWEERRGAILPVEPGADRRRSNVQGGCARDGRC